MHVLGHVARDLCVRTVEAETASVKPSVARCPQDPALFEHGKFFQMVKQLVRQDFEESSKDRSTFLRLLARHAWELWWTDVVALSSSWPALAEGLPQACRREGMILPHQWEIPDGREVLSTLAVLSPEGAASRGPCLKLPNTCHCCPQVSAWTPLAGRLPNVPGVDV
jgi:hypothetical protein